MFEVGINLLQEVNGVIDKQGQPGQAKKDPWSHEDAVPVWVYLVWVIICEGIKESWKLQTVKDSVLITMEKHSNAIRIPLKPGENDLLYLPQSLQNQLCWG